jgi:hypothetical protein
VCVCVCLCVRGVCPEQRRVFQLVLNKMHNNHINKSKDTRATRCRDLLNVHEPNSAYKYC